METRILAGVGIGIVLLALVSGVLWQASKLIAIGQENGRLTAEVKSLKIELTIKVEEVKAGIEEAERLLNECNGAITSANFVAATWEARYHELQTNIPSMEAEPIEIISEGCVPALAEGRSLAAAEIHRLLEGGEYVTPN